MSLIRDPATGTSQLYLYVLHEPQHSNSVFTFRGQLKPHPDWYPLGVWESLVTINCGHLEGYSISSLTASWKRLLNDVMWAQSTWFDRTKLSRPRLAICFIQTNPSWLGYSPIDIHSRVIKTGDVVSLPAWTLPWAVTSPRDTRQERRSLARSFPDFARTTGQERTTRD